MQIIQKPLVTEKSTKLVDKNNVYSFLVDRRANKVEIKKEIEKHYAVQVLSVNTFIVNQRVKTRNTKTGVVKGKKTIYKKAMVELKRGDKIDLFESN